MSSAILGSLRLGTFGLGYPLGDGGGLNDDDTLAREGIREGDKGSGGMSTSFTTASFVLSFSLSYFCSTYHRGERGAPP